MYAKYLCYAKYCFVQKVSNKQSTEVICRFDRLITAQSKRQISHMSIGNLMSGNTFDYTALRVKHGLMSCENLAIALQTYMTLLGFLQMFS